MQTRDPMYEFFKLTCTSVKILSPHMNIICQINEDKLYKKAQDDNVEFFRWHSWIELMLSKEVLNQIFTSKQKSLPDNLIIEDKKKKTLTDPTKKRKSKT